MLSQPNRKEIEATAVSGSVNWDNVYEAQIRKWYGLLGAGMWGKMPYCMKDVMSVEWLEADEDKMGFKEDQRIEISSYYVTATAALPCSTWTVH